MHSGSKVLFVVPRMFLRYQKRAFVGMAKRDFWCSKSLLLIVKSIFRGAEIVFRGTIPVYCSAKSEIFCVIKSAF